MTHYPAIKCIETRIESLNKEVYKTELKLESIEKESAYHFVISDLANLTNEINSLKQTLKHLVK
tara:strand:+ start:47 stop:238 length:192 start_codon:yes stop_codon:yes gene_type:complete